jgi:hypothetical protein
MAQKMWTTEEKALHAIMQAESSKQTYKKIQDTFGTQQFPLTHVDIIDNTSIPSHPHITLTCQSEIETHILDHNRRYSLQSLATPFLSIPFLQEAIDPSYGNTKFDEISNGTFLEDIPSNVHLSPTEEQWISSLQQIVHHEIPLTLSCEDFRAFFRAKGTKRPR